jgi:hypothetical protein
MAAELVERIWDVGAIATLQAVFGGAILWI